jgi:beta-galactosidase
MHPDKCLGVSEYGAENILMWHSAEPENHDYTEEYANHYHQEMLKTFATRPYLWATHQWNCFDFAADARNEGGVQGRNSKGLITYDRKIKKDAFYLYKAWWNPEPMVFVSGCRFVNRGKEERNVIVYTNCDQVTLVVNGQDVATKQAQDHMIVFENVIVDGENIVTAYAGDVKSNEVKFVGVEEHDYSYDLPEGNQGANWFDDPELVAMKKAFKYPKDAFSIKDKMGALMDHPEAGALLGNLMQGFMSGNSMMASMGEMSPEMMKFMRNMRLSDALKMAGGAVSMEMKLKLNLALNQIKK